MATSATSRDNIFINDYDNTLMSGKVLTTLLNQLTQILIIPIQNTTRHKEQKLLQKNIQEIQENKDITSRDLQNTNWDMELQLNL